MCVCIYYFDGFDVEVMNSAIDLTGLPVNSSSQSLEAGEFKVRSLTPVVHLCYAVLMHIWFSSIEYLACSKVGCCLCF